MRLLQRLLATVLVISVVGIEPLVVRAELSVDVPEMTRTTNIIATQPAVLMANHLIKFIGIA
jgi:hypothetical protein